MIIVKIVKTSVAYAFSKQKETNKTNWKVFSSKTVTVFF